jgi:hypothetical protein
MAVKKMGMLRSEYQESECTDNKDGDTDTDRSRLTEADVCVLSV